MVQLVGNHKSTKELPALMPSKREKNVKNPKTYRQKLRHVVKWFKS